MEELTSWVPPQDEFTDLVIDEDEEAVGDSTAPPQHPEEEDRAQIDMGGADTKKLAASSQQAKLLQNVGGGGWVGGWRHAGAEQTSGGTCAELCPFQDSRTGTQPELSQHTGRRSALCSWRRGEEDKRRRGQEDKGRRGQVSRTRGGENRTTRV